MTAATDQDIQQIKDLITNLDKKIDGLDKRIDVGLAEVKAELKGIHTELGDIKTNQRGQDNRFFGLLLFFLTVAIGITTKLAKLY